MIIWPSCATKLVEGDARLFGSIGKGAGPRMAPGVVRTSNAGGVATVLPECPSFAPSFFKSGVIRISFFAGAGTSVCSEVFTIGCVGFVEASGKVTAILGGVHKVFLIVGATELFEGIGSAAGASSFGMITLAFFKETTNLTKPTLLGRSTDR